MAASVIWRQCVFADPTVATTAVTESLVAAGVASYVADADVRSGPGIVVFDGVTTAVCEAVRSASRAGRERVIAEESRSQASRARTRGVCCHSVHVT